MKTYYFNCPGCGQNREFNEVNEQGGAGCLIFLLLGLLPALLFWDLKQGRIQCQHCGLIFRKPAYPSTGLAGLSVFVIIMIFLLACIFGGFYGSQTMNDASRYCVWIRDTANFVSRHSVYIALCVLPAFALTVISVVFGGLASQVRKNYQTRKNYFYKPGQHESIEPDKENIQ